MDAGGACFVECTDALATVRRHAGRLNAERTAKLQSLGAKAA
jgi:hypothetical protein